MTKLLLSSCLHSSLALKPWSLLRRSLVGISTASLLLGSFSVAQAATQSVSLAWNTTTDPSVVGYNVNYGTSSGSYTQTLNAGSSTSATISSLAAGQTYYFSSPPATPPLRTAWPLIKSHLSRLRPVPRRRFLLRLLLPPLLKP